MIKYKQALVLIVLFIFSWVDLSAQLLKNDVIYLKNGSVIQGNLVYQTTDSVKIETFCQNIFAYSINEILEIKQENSSHPKSEQEKEFVPGNFKGFYSYSTFGLLVGNSDITDSYTFSFNTSAGYEFNHYLGVGLGLGVEKLKTELVPLFISIKSNLTNNITTPTISFYIGYSFPLSENKKEDNIDYDYEGGINLGFDLGICSFKTNHRAFTISAGYQYQVLKEKSTFYYWGGDNAFETNIYEFNKITIRIGFMFR